MKQYFYLNIIAVNYILIDISIKQMKNRILGNIPDIVHSN